jgi:release factor glutamine methyltransferase
MSVENLLKQAIASLMGVSGSPRLDAYLMLGHVLNQPREYLIAHSERLLTPLEQSTFEKLLRLRTKGMPLAYILGQRPFFDRQFTVTSQVLIPRPETENLVEAALAWGKDRGPFKIVDVGTGSGVIAVTLAAHLPQAQVIATDVSSGALVIAQLNAAGLTNIQFAQSDLLAAVCGPIDLLCANLPYIATGELDILEVAKFEPHVALDGGADGLSLIRRLLEQAPSRLRQSSLVLLEIGADQGMAVQQLGAATFRESQVTLLKDLAGLDRIVRIENQVSC